MPGIGTLSVNPRIQIILFLLVFGAGPFYLQSNWGGQALALPFNYGVWMAVSVFIGVGLLRFCRQPSLVVPDIWPFFVLVPVTVVVSGLFADQSNTGSLFFRELALVAGLAFWFFLHQGVTSRRQLEWLLFLFACTTLPHALIGILQSQWPAPIANFIPTNALLEPTGVFQQVNLQAVYLATGVAGASAIQHCTGRAV